MSGLFLAVWLCLAVMVIVLAVATRYAFALTSGERQRTERTAGDTGDTNVELGDPDGTARGGTASRTESVLVTIRFSSRMQLAAAIPKSAFEVGGYAGMGRWLAEQVSEQAKLVEARAARTRLLIRSSILAGIVATLTTAVVIVRNAFYPSVGGVFASYLCSLAAIALFGSAAYYGLWGMTRRRTEEAMRQLAKWANLTD